MQNRIECEHLPGRWEVNEIKKFFTVRCVPCGRILERITFDEASTVKVLAIQNYMKRLT